MQYTMAAAAYSEQQFQFFQFGTEDPPLTYSHFGTWKKTCYMKFVLVGLYGVPF